MDRGQVEGKTFLCPMHREIRQQGPGKCPKCGMGLLPEGTRFGLLRHLIRNPWMLVIMAAVMLALMVMLLM